MKDAPQPSANIIQRYIGLQITLLIFGITMLTLGLSSAMNYVFDSGSMQRDMEHRAIDTSGLLRMIIDKPMVVGDDAGTSEEFKFLREKLEGVEISLASFSGSVTYSTIASQVRQDVKSLFAGKMSAADLALF